MGKIIVATTETGRRLYWGYGEWHETAACVEEFNSLKASFIKGTLISDYIGNEWNEPETYKGMRIINIKIV